MHFEDDELFVVVNSHVDLLQVARYNFVIGFLVAFGRAQCMVCQSESSGRWFVSVTREVKYLVSGVGV